MIFELEIFKIKNNAYMYKKICFLLSLFIITSSFQITNNKNISRGGEKMKIMSPAFEEGALIPQKYTCIGINISPPLKWSEVPDETKSFVIICDDPDALIGPWVHWLIYNIPADINELPEHVAPLEILPNGAKQGRNDFMKIGYCGPCPPWGAHHCYFKLYALEEVLNVEAGITKSELLKAMEGHIFSTGQLMVMGGYKR